MSIPFDLPLSSAWRCFLVNKWIEEKINSLLIYCALCDYWWDAISNRKRKYFYFVSCVCSSVCERERDSETWRWIHFHLLHPHSTAMKLHFYKYFVFSRRKTLHRDNLIKCTTKRPKTVFEIAFKNTFSALIQFSHSLEYSVFYQLSSLNALTEKKMQICRIFFTFLSERFMSLICDFRYVINEFCKRPPFIDTWQPEYANFHKNYINLNVQSNSTSIDFIMILSNKTKNYERWISWLHNLLFIESSSY